jgi:hypothetical protein
MIKHPLFSFIRVVPSKEKDDFAAIFAAKIEKIPFPRGSHSALRKE